MWNYDRTLDIYRHAEKQKYFVDIESDKVFPGRKTFYLCDEPEELSWKLISTDIYAALDEAESLILRLEEQTSDDNS